jgi:hypothetical protein
MTLFVVDTNVPIIANGRGEDGAPPSDACKEAAVAFLNKLVTKGVVLLDNDGAIQDEYRRYLKPHGQPGVGDLFYLVVIRSAPRLVRRIPLPIDESGEFVDFPKVRKLAEFDRSDRKFAALARRAGARVVNATDSDWVHFRQDLEAHRIKIEFLCGCDVSQWHKRDEPPRSNVRLQKGKPQ